MRKFTFLKTLLMAACLCGESSALADPTLVYGRAVTADLENGYTAWSSDDIGSGRWVASSGTASIDTNNRGLKVAQQRGSALATNSSQISITPGSIITIDAVWNTGYSSGGDDENNAFTIGNNIEIRAYTYNQHGDIYINGSKYATITNACIKDNNRDHDPWTIHLVVNTGTNKITDFTIRGANGTNKATYTLDGTISLNAGSTYNSLSLAHNRTKGNNALEACYLTSVKITEEAQTLTTADVTFTYAKTDGTSLTTYRADEVASGVTVGTDISSLISTYGTTFYNSTSNKYVYSSYSVTGDYTTVQEGGNTVTLKYTDYPATPYTVMAQAGGSNLTSVASGTAYLDGSTTAYYSKYVKHNGSWYETSSPYGVAISAATTNIAYTISDIDYFCEGENMNGYDAASDKRGTNYSGKITGRPKANSVWYTDPVTETGVYTVSFPYELIANTSASTLAGLYVRSGSGELTLIEENVSLSSNSTYTKTNVIIPAGSSFQISKGANNSNYGIDYVTLKRTGDAAVPVTVTSAGWATFASPYALDLSSMTASEGTVEAYYASNATGSTVTLTSTNSSAVAAGEGLMLKGTAGATITIPVVASGSAIAGNLLKGQTTTGNVDASNKNDNGKYHYVFGYSKSDATEYGFYNLTADTEVAAGKAYLETTTALTAGARLTIIFDDETTGIADVRSKMSDVRGDFFDLSGRKVAQPTKGLYIVNGKKVVIK